MPEGWLLESKLGAELVEWDKQAELASLSCKGACSGEGAEPGPRMVPELAKCLEWTCMSLEEQGMELVQEKYSRHWRLDRGRHDRTYVKRLQGKGCRMCLRS